MPVIGGVYFFDVPIMIRTGHTSRAKNWYVNLNVYRNSHRLTLGNVKNRFNIYVAGLKLPPIPFDPPYEFTYLLHRQRHPVIDVANICSVVDKFTCDALIKLGILEDDNCDVIPAVHYAKGTGVKKKDDAYCRVIIMRHTEERLREIADVIRSIRGKKL